MDDARYLPTCLPNYTATQLTTQLPILPDYVARSTYVYPTGESYVSGRILPTSTTIPPTTAPSQTARADFSMDMAVCVCRYASR